MTTTVDPRPASSALLAALVFLALPGCESAETPPWQDDGAAPAAPCQPACGPESCGAQDGCGGRCACPHEASCLSCPLRLVRGATAPDGAVSLTVESSAVAGAPLPRLAELHIAANHPVEVVRVALGPALAAARKRLYRFTDTDLPWQRLPDGSIRLLVYSGSKHTPVAPGRWLTLRVALPDPPDGAFDTTFRLVRRPEVLAPAAADAALQRSAYDTPLVVPARSGR